MKGKDIHERCTCQLSCRLLSLFALREQLPLGHTRGTNLAMKIQAESIGSVAGAGFALWNLGFWKGALFVRVWVDT